MSEPSERQVLLRALEKLGVRSPSQMLRLMRDVAIALSDALDPEENLLAADLVEKLLPEEMAHRDVMHLIWYLLSALLLNTEESS